MAIVSLPLPIQLINGNVADGGQVMTDLNAIASNVNSNAAKNGVNSDITALTALVSISSGLTITGATIFGSTISGSTITGSTFDGGTISNSFIDATNTVPTLSVGTSTDQIASTAFVMNTSFSTFLPVISPLVTNYFLTNNGTSANWDFLLKAGTIRFADSVDTTKRIAFDLTAISTATTRTIFVTNGDVTLQSDNDRAEELFAYALYF